MFKPENTSVENIEKSSVNRFDPGYKNLAVIKKSLVQVAGWSDIRETGPRKMTFGALTAWKICSILTISSVSASAPRGAVSIFFWNDFSCLLEWLLLLLWLFLTKIYLSYLSKNLPLKVHWKYFVPLNCKNVLVLEKKLHIFHREKQTYFLDSYAPSAVSSPASHPPGNWAIVKTSKQTDPSL